MCLFCACEQTAPPVTQLVVRVEAEPALAERLTQLRAEIYHPDTWEQTRVHEFALAAADESRKTQDFPFSFGVLQGDADRALIVLRGFGDGGTELIQEKALVRFEADVIRLVVIQLRAECLGLLCEALDQTCRGDLGGSQVACGSVLEASTRRIRAGEEQSQTSAVGDRDAAVLDAGGDATTERRDAAADAALSTGRDADAAGSDARPGPGDPVYALASVDAPCSEADARACAAHAGQQPLRCSGGAWRKEAACAAGQLCDSRRGTAQGTCSEIASACKAAQLAGESCDGKLRVQCDVTLLTAELHPCAEHAHCEQAQAVLCVCDDGYVDDGTGACLDPDDCPAAACGNGTCVDGIGDYSCDCPSGYLGTGTKACTKAIYCPEDVCTPGGSCDDKLDWSCQCRAGFSGTGSKVCENIDDCKSAACKAPNGVCSDAIGGYNCACNPGFSGTDCRNDVCAPNPCQNGATCSRTNTGASCQCLPGYEGDRCQINVNDCLGHRCQNGGSCVDGLGKYTCDCDSSGWRGEFCETDIDECAQANNGCSGTTMTGLSFNYPCLNARPGFVCAGKQAMWHMPDPMPGAKFKPSYDTTTPGVTKDLVTGLSWQGEPEKSYAGCPAAKTNGHIQCTWSEARAYCSQLVLAGKSDWRLPTHIELASLLDHTRRYPAFNPAAFPFTDTTYHWSDSPYVGMPWSEETRVGQAFMVDFGDGVSSAFPIDFTMSVKCVRSEALPSAAIVARYQWDLGNDTIKDMYTELEWRRQSNDTFQTWDQARSYCAGLGNGWRLPTPNELNTIVDPTRVNPALDPIFPKAYNYTWSVQSPFFADEAWIVVIDQGSSQRRGKNADSGVRCVR
jgi:hypothetical protein